MRNFAQDAAKLIADLDKPYRGVIDVRILWGERVLFDKFKWLSLSWKHTLSFKYESEKRGFLNTHVTITCEGPKEYVILWVSNFATINGMKAKKFEYIVEGDNDEN